MKPDKQRLVFRPDWADAERPAILVLPRGHVLRGIGPDGKLREFVLADFLTMDYHAGIHRNQALVRDVQRVDFDFPDPVLFNAQLG